MHFTLRDDNFLSLSVCVYVCVGHRDGLKRQSYLSSLSDISNDNQEADLVS